MPHADRCAIAIRTRARRAPRVLTLITTSIVGASLLAPHARAQSITQIDVGRFPSGSCVPNGTILTDQWQELGILFASRRSTEPVGQPGTLTTRSYGSACANYLFFSPDVFGAVAIFRFVEPGTATPADAVYFEIRADMQSGETLELVGLDEANQVVVTSVYTGAGAKRASISGVFRAAEARTFGNPGIGFSGQWSPTDLGIKFQQCLTATASGGLVACPLAPAVFAVSSRGTGPISHQWQARGGPALEWTDLTDGPNSVASEFLLNAAGAASPTLTVDRSPVGWTAPLEFRCVVSNACGTLTTDAAMLKLAPDMTAGAIPGSPSYGVPNGLVNNDDFFYFLSAFAAGNLALADLTTGAVAGQPGYGTPDGVLNNDDFFYYLNIFAAGC